MTDIDYMTNPEAILGFTFEHHSKTDVVVITRLLAQDLIKAQRRIAKALELIDAGFYDEAVRALRGAE